MITKRCILPLVLTGKLTGYKPAMAKSPPFSGFLSRFCEVTYQHVQLEAWMGNYPATWTLLQKYKTAPKLVTSMGCLDGLGRPRVDELMAWVGVYDVYLM